MSPITVAFLSCVTPDGNLDLFAICGYGRVLIHDGSALTSITPESSQNITSPSAAGSFLFCATVALTAMNVKHEACGSDLSTRRAALAEKGTASRYWFCSRPRCFTSERARSESKAQHRPRCRA